MDEEIRIGLDFGTHQTKICIQKRPDEGHGLPEYEFMQFVDLEGKAYYYIPSVIQVNKDDTLSYGFVNPDQEKDHRNKPSLKIVAPQVIKDINAEAIELYTKYNSDIPVNKEALDAIKNMLGIKNVLFKKRYEEEKIRVQNEYERAMEEYHRQRNVFRYFKQATFAEYPWEGKYSPELLCIWYLSYIIFLLEDRFGDAFSINLGVPTDDNTYEKKKKLGVQILRSAYYLVEEVYHKKLKTFLNEKIEDLIKKTVIFDYSEEDKNDYIINVFPEAYASLIGLTSRGKLSEGMSINADIGGGTTDISFFIVNEGIPKIYKYWSIPCGLNYIAERSGFDYSDENFMKRANKDVIEKFNNKKESIVYNLVKELISLLKRSNPNFPTSNLRDALKDRILVYTGGGSTYPDISTPIHLFSDVKTVDSELWTEEIMHDKKNVMKLANLLTTSFGLSVSEDDHEVVLCDFNSLFSNFTNNERYEKEEIDKDVC